MSVSQDLCKDLLNSAIIESNATEKHRRNPKQTHDDDDGRQYGNECFCGESDEPSDYEVNGPNVCHMPCYGDDSVACGGYWGFSLYKYADDEKEEEEEPTAPEVPAPTPAPTPKPVRLFVLFGAPFFYIVEEALPF